MTALVWLVSAFVACVAQPGPLAAASPDHPSAVCRAVAGHRPAAWSATATELAAHEFPADIDQDTDDEQEADGARLLRAGREDGRCTFCPGQPAGAPSAAQGFALHPLRAPPQ